MVELRKRPAPKEAPQPAAKRSVSKPRATTKAKQVAEQAKAAVTDEPSTTTAIPDTEPTTTTTTNQATLPLDSTSTNKTLPKSALSTTTTLNTGSTSTLSAHLSSSTNGIIIFTYPKASTPGCTTQACLFRDHYDEFRAKGYDVYGLSNDSEKANSGFKAKQNLQYDMLCDPDAKLTGVLGMKKPGAAKGTLRGVVVITKDGVVEVWFQGGPPKTLDAVKAFLGL